MKGLAIARTLCSSYQWQFITRPPYLHHRLNHIRIQHRIYFRTRIRTIIHPLRLHRLVPPQLSTQITHCPPPTRTLLRRLHSPCYPNQFQPLYIHSLLFRPIELTMGNFGSRRLLPHTSVTRIRINPHHLDQRVPMLPLRRHRSCQLACLFRAHPSTSTSISHTSSISTAPHNLKRRWVAVHALRGYPITFVQPRARGPLLLRR